MPEESIKELEEDIEVIQDSIRDTIILLDEIVAHDIDLYNFG